MGSIGEGVPPSPEFPSQALRRRRSVSAVSEKLQVAATSRWRSLAVLLHAMRRRGLD